MLCVAHVCVWTGETCACAAWCEPRLLVVAGFCGRRAHLRSVVRLCCLSWLLPPVVGPGCLPRAPAVGDVRPLSVPGCCRLSWARVVWCELRLSVVNSCRILLEPVACGCWPGPCRRPASAARIKPILGESRRLKVKDAQRHNAYPSGTHTKQIRKTNRTITKRFAHHSRLFELNGNHMTSVSACVLFSKHWRLTLKKKSSALRAQSMIALYVRFEITISPNTAALFRHGVASAL